MRQKIVVAVLCAIFGACSCQRAPDYAVPVPVYITPFVPPPEYARWYALAEQCAGMQGNFAAIRWGVVPGPWGKLNQPTYGHWTVERDTAGFVKHVDIVVNALWWRDSVYIMHEELHDILWRNGWVPPVLPALASNEDSIANVHPSPPFGKCAPVYSGKLKP